MEMRKRYEAHLWEGFRQNAVAFHSPAAEERQRRGDVSHREFRGWSPAETKGTPAEVRQVWARNLKEEFHKILEALETSEFAAIDSEFPGFIYHTDRSASPRQRYEDVRRNVDGMKVLQIGFSFFDGEGRRRRTWQINFRDFDIFSPSDARWEQSIELLKNSGLDFIKTRRDGVDSAALLALLRRHDWAHRLKPLWVTFQGLYDVAYLLKLLTGVPLPPTLQGFARLAGEMLGSVVDVRHVTRDTTVGYLGLTALSRSLGLTSNKGSPHQAGADSLITGMVFSRIAEWFDVTGEVGILSGIEEEKIVACVPEGRWDLPPIQTEEIIAYDNLPSSLLIPCGCRDCSRPRAHGGQFPNHHLYTPRYVLYFVSSSI